MKISVMIFVVLFFVSCNVENEEFQDPRDASLLALEYLSLDDNQYTLNLSEETASKLGISKQNYDRMLDEVRSANEQIQEWIKDPDANFVLTNPRDVSVQIDDPISLKSRSESYIPSGNIVTDGQEFGYDTFFANTGIKSVDFLCRSNAALTPVYNVTTETCGEVRTSGGIGTIGTNSSYTVKLAFSNVDANLSFRTSDGNGGNAAWRANY